MRRFKRPIWSIHPIYQAHPLIGLAWAGVRESGHARLSGERTGAHRSIAARFVNTTRGLRLGNAHSLARKSVYAVAGEQGLALEAVRQLVDRFLLVVKVQC